MNAIHNLAQEVRVLLSRIDELEDGLPPSATKKLRLELDEVARELRTRLAGLDPVRLPTAFFDPADPRLFGVLAAIALIGRERVPLSDLTGKRFYGSGIYALYYKGPRPLYRSIRGTETPIYVGKAGSFQGGGRTPQEQGMTLSTRLDEHRKSIKMAKNLSVSHFTCRHLVIATGYEGAAERALIALFHPIWNKEIRVLWGLGKHGDSAETRRNKRSPWDVLHPGRPCAASKKLTDAKTTVQIRSEVRSHFSVHSPVRSLHQVLRALTDRIAAM